MNEVSKTKPDYLSVTYSEARAPKTDYPRQLIAYLIERFQIKPGAKLLELGCGRGDFLRAFAAAGLDCHGVDRVSSAQDLSANLKVSTCDIANEPLPYADASFDVVYHKSVIEHFSSPEHLMRETHRVLKPGGKCIILTPDWVSCMRVFFEDITHIRPFDRAALRDTYLLFGFRNFTTELFYQLPVLWKFPFLKLLSKFFGVIMNEQTARRLTGITGIKFFRWSVELMVLGYGEKDKT